MYHREKKTFHVVLGSSAGGCLMLAFERKQLDADQKVVVLTDDLSFGPIGLLTAEARAEWNQNALGYEVDDAGYGFSSEASWASAANSKEQIVVWLHRRCAQEYSNFLEFIFRRRSAKVMLMDVTNIELASDGERREMRRCSADFSIEQMIEIFLTHSPVELSHDEVIRYSDVWKTLKSEDAALRVLSGSELKSAPISFFDDGLLNFADTDWTECIEVVWKTLNDGPYLQSDPYVLWPRLRHLVSSARLECRGDISRMRGSFVRRSR